MSLAEDNSVWQVVKLDPDLRSEPKVIHFPLLTLEPKLPMSVGPVWKIRNKMSNLTLRGLVYLTWTTLFVSAGIPKKTEETVVIKGSHLPKGSAPN